jgi:hypothetical protein
MWIRWIRIRNTADREQKEKSKHPHTDDVVERQNLPGGVILLCELGEDVDEVVVEIRELERTQMTSIS